MWLVQFDKCEGKDSENYSRVGINEYDAQCSPWSGRRIYQNLMVSKSNGEKVIISLVSLAKSTYPAGGKKYIIIFYQDQN